MLAERIDAQTERVDRLKAEYRRANRDYQDWEKMVRALDKAEITDLSSRLLALAVERMNEAGDDVYELIDALDNAERLLERYRDEQREEWDKEEAALRREFDRDRM